jgi:hypothetical protein
VGQGAGRLDLALEPGDGRVRHLVDVQELDGGRPAEHGVPGPVHRPHPPGPELLLQGVLAELFGLEDGRVEELLLPRHDQHGDEDADGGQPEEPHQPPEGPTEDKDRGERLVPVDLGGHPQVVFGQPRPGPDLGHPAVPAVPVRVAPRPPGHAVGRHPGERLVGPPRGRPLARGHVHPGVADVDRQDGLGVGQVGQQADPFEVVVEPAVGQHQPVPVEGIGLTRLAGPGHLQDASELLVWADADGQDDGPGPVRPADRGGREHRRHVSPELPSLVLEKEPASERYRHRRAGHADPLEEFALITGHRLADRQILVGR